MKKFDRNIEFVDLGVFILILSASFLLFCIGIAIVG